MTRFMGLPRGSTDRLPPHGRTRRRRIDTLLDVFERWGYGLALTPLVEFYDVLARGLSPADRKTLVRFTEAGRGDVVALRSDLTPQIARMVADRLGTGLGRETAVRLCYAAEVARHARADRDKAELHQVGVELLGDGEPANDAEIVVLCHEALRACGLQGARIDLSHRRVTGDVLDRLELSDPERAQAVALLAKKDRGGLHDLLVARGASPPLVAAATELCDLYGSPDIVRRAVDVLEAAGARAALSRLELVLDAVRRLSRSAYASIELDLGETRGFDYYTGLRLRVWAPGVADPVVRGGRYDDLLARYGAPAPAIGFAVDLEALQTALGDANDPVPAPRTHLVSVAATAATHEARGLAAAWTAWRRAQGDRSWAVVGLTLEQAMGRAREVGATGLTQLEVADDGELESRHYVETDGAWSPMSGPSTPPVQEQA